MCLRQGLLQQAAASTLLSGSQIVMDATPFNIAVVGPARSLQGTGPYITRAFHQLGCDIRAVVSSSLQSATAAANHLDKEYGIGCQAFASIEELLEAVPIDIVAICSPPTTHHRYLQAAMDADCHIFCEKPLWWPEQEVRTPECAQHLADETLRLVQRARRRNINLQLNTQWVYTLPGFYALHCQQNPAPQTIKTFSMWLSPQSTGKQMIIDAVPHALSMLYAIFGAGRIQELRCDSPGDNPDQDLQILFDYLHATGDCTVSLDLNSTDVLPKPAAYALNRQRVDRHVELPDYLISLRSSGKQVPIMDPLTCSVKNYLGSIYSGCGVDETALVDGMEHLLQIYLAIDA